MNSFQRMTCLTHMASKAMDWRCSRQMSNQRVQQFPSRKWFLLFLTLLKISTFKQAPLMVFLAHLCLINYFSSASKPGCNHTDQYITLGYEEFGFLQSCTWKGKTASISKGWDMTSCRGALQRRTWGSWWRLSMSQQTSMASRSSYRLICAVLVPGNQV